MQGYSAVETTKPSVEPSKPTVNRKIALFSWKWLKWERETMFIIVILTWSWLTIDFIRFNQGKK